MKIAGALLFSTVILLLIRQGAMDFLWADDDVARIIAARNEQMWQAYLEKNVVAHNAILSDDYTSIHRDGSLHDGPPSAAAIASAPIAAFSFSQFRVSPLAENAVLATYIADVGTPARHAACACALRCRDGVGETTKRVEVQVLSGNNCSERSLHKLTCTFPCPYGQ